jgi:hypothetical protein
MSEDLKQKFEKVRESISQEMASGFGLMFYRDYLVELRSETIKTALAGDEIQFEKVKGQWALLNSLITKLDSEFKNQKKAGKM